MKKALLAGIALVLFGVSAASAGVIEDRQAIMKSFSNAANTVMLFTRDSYTPTAASAQFQIMLDGAAKLGDLFPPGSDVDTETAKTLALPTVWTDMPGFQMALAKFTADVKVVQATKDVASFAAAYPQLAKDCDACHGAYRERLTHRPGGEQ